MARCVAIIAIFIFLLLPGTGPARVAAQVAESPGQAVVRPRAYASLEPVPRGRIFDVGIVVEIQREYHMNSHKPLDEFLIPTTLTAQFPQGFREVETSYPEGQLRKFAFASTSLSVYSGSVTLRMRVEAATDAPLGSATLPFILRYQACNDTTCLPPVKLPVSVSIQVAPAGAKTRPIHEDIFAKLKATPPK
jgi:DsbC/DsbD-like thiol-disulfide interchange protein